MKALRPQDDHLVYSFSFIKVRQPTFFGRIRGCEKRILFWKKLLKKKNEREIFLLIDFFFFLQLSLIVGKVYNISP